MAQNTLSASSFPAPFSPIHTTLTTLELPPQTGVITALAWSEDNAHLAAVSASGMLVIWRASDGTCLLSQRVTRARLCAVAWSRQGRSLLVGSDRGTLSIYHLATQSLIHSTIFPAPVAQIACSPNAIDTRFFVRTGSTLHLLTQGQAEPRTLRYPTPLVDACWSPGGQAIALVCANGLVEVCDARTRHVLWNSTGAQSGASRATWDATGRRLVIGMADGTVQMHDLRTDQCSTPMPLSRFPIRALRWGERYLVAGSEREVTFWKETDPQPHCQPTETMPAFTFDSHGAVLATAWPHAIALTALS